MQRIKILQKITFIAFAIILLRLFFIQIIDHENWLTQAKDLHTILETITAKRGEIYMMDAGNPVAVVVNQTVYSVIIDPSIVKRDSLEELLSKYAKDYITADLEQVFNVEGLRYYIVARNVPHSAATEIAKADVAGVWLQKSNHRVYPEGEMASGLLGFVNNDGVGQYGVEGSLNSLLSGSDGLLKTIADVNSVALSIGNDNVRVPAVDGKNIVLSVDRGLESKIEELATSAIESTSATNIAVLVMRPNTGEVLAMGNLPNYNPGDYGHVKDATAYLNYVTEVPYEPASICKSFAYSAAINEGVMSADTTYFNKHYELIDGWKIWNASRGSNLYGSISMRFAFAWSLNTGSIHALKLLGGNPEQITKEGREKLYDYYYNKFRLGQPTGIELIEAQGYIEDPNEGWGRDSTYANMTFGQNLGITMIQTATAFSAIVNGGYYRTPTIVKGELKNGEIVSLDRDSKVIEEQVISESTSATMRELLINNRASRRRTGVDRPGYAIGGKTGTAQVVRDGAYDDTMSELVGSYIGFIGPSDKMPEYVVMVKMWGEGQSVSSEDANRLFDQISNFIIDYFKIQPTML